MPKLDDAIRATLAAEDRELLAQFEKEPNLFEEAIQAMTGRMVWINLVVSAVMLIFFAAAVYCGWKFFTVADLREAIAWGAGATFGVVTVGILKIWFWMEMQSNRVIREIKRLELQVAALAKASV